MRRVAGCQNGGQYGHEAWTKDNEPCVGECVGVLGLIVHKLNLIEHEAQAVMDRRKVAS